MSFEYLLKEGCNKKMRINLKNNPTIIVKDYDYAQKIKSMARSDRKTLLDEKEYVRSVEKASRLVKKAAFSINR